MAYNRYESTVEDSKLAQSNYIGRVKELFIGLIDRMNTLTATDIGLGNVADYPPATDQEAAAGSSSETLITPAQLSANVYSPLALAFQTAAGKL